MGLAATLEVTGAGVDLTGMRGIPVSRVYFKNGIGAVGRMPQGLKPHLVDGSIGTTEVVP
jgi:hypothetical protein